MHHLKRFSRCVVHMSGLLYRLSLLDCTTSFKSWASLLCFLCFCSAASSDHRLCEKEKPLLKKNTLITWREVEKKGEIARRKRKGRKKIIYSVLWWATRTLEAVSVLLCWLCVDVTHTHTLTTPYYTRKQRVYLYMVHNNSPPFRWVLVE